MAYVQFWILQLGGLMPQPDELDGTPSTDELAFLIGCRRVPLADLDLAVPAAARQRLDRMVRENAERSLRALDFLRAHGA